jgi:hypothetical protein
MLLPSFALALFPSVFAAVHDVQVGNGGKLQYTPEAIVSVSQILSALRSFL